MGHISGNVGYVRNGACQIENAGKPYINRYRNGDWYDDVTGRARMYSGFGKISPEAQWSNF